MVQEKKEWWKSKTNWAGILTGVGIAIPGIVSGLEGNGLGIQQVWTGIVVILGILGIRGLPVLNQK